MLQSVEVLPAHRATLRRDVRIGCELTTDALGARREVLVDLSPRGARVMTDAAVEPGDHVLLGFADERLGRRVETIARVAHTAHLAIERPSIGVEFVALDDDLGDALALRLRHVPPPLPHRRARRELVWIDALVTWEEDLGDRVNVFEVSEALAAIDDDELAIETLAPVLTGSARPYRWIC
ncbi:PilZ domain-containing protein [Sandaracinus amylolyticus]|uniref:PilZ domain-containing protein n=1 Tax=Sandaracinus amylolyticus TaxID=927083 RepID=UPI001F0312E9|nr:PilZ domain-containing protein [Sandaracinus amylolyticus]UJR81345.1 PilZ domain-containing protein [Sandaracinus amylolyticus]